MQRGETLARVRRLGARGAFDIMLDGLVACLACLVLAWVYVITPTLLHQHIPFSVQAALRKASPGTNSDARRRMFERLSSSPNEEALPPELEKYLLITTS